MSLAILGRGGFEDSYLPVKGKSEWGMDTLTRKLQGARSLLESFIATLQQGQIYQDYFLQTWEPDDKPDVATITLNYKGLLTGGTPLPRIRTEITPASGSISAVYADENGGKGRLYKIVPLYRLTYGIPEAGIVLDEVVATREIYTTGATVDFTYDAIQSTYQYISIGKPSGPRYNVIDIGRSATIRRSRLTTADGSIYGSRVPNAFISLTPNESSRVIGFISDPVIGTPFWECEDVVRKELGE